MPKSIPDCMCVFCKQRAQSQRLGQLEQMVSEAQQPAPATGNFLNLEPITDEQRMSSVLMGRLANLADVAAGRAKMSEEHWVREARKSGWSVKV